MPENRNMGRRSHHQQDEELKANYEEVDQVTAASKQPTRPTVHPAHADKSSDEQPLQSHSRRGE